MTLLVAPHPGGTPGITLIVPSKPCRSERCEMRLHIGVFFDGTGNNRYADEPIFKDSNVARLFRAYKDASLEGYFPLYVPGIGTRFPEIGEEHKDGDKWGLGLGLGRGGEGRINYGLLHVLNSLHRSISSNEFLVLDSTILALCRNKPRGAAYVDEYGFEHRASLAGAGDEAALKLVGMDTKGGLLSVWPSGASERTAFFKTQFAALAAKIRETEKPKITHIHIDVFGFSRGAAQARVFTNWLLAHFSGNTLCGVNADIRFLGLFDTVASVGVPASMPWLGNKSAGHLDWGDAKNLRVSYRVKNCHHYMALHEHRASFPVEPLGVTGQGAPSHFREYGFPGMHSDVGGGYTPVDQGRGPKKFDSEKLSQIPLNRMYEAARAAGVPVDRDLALNIDNKKAFDCDPDTASAYANFFDETGTAPRLLRDWLLDFLTWRYQVRERYSRLPASQRNRLSYDDLEGANRILLDDAHLLARLSGAPGIADYLHRGLTINSPLIAWALEKGGFAPDYDRAKKRLREMEREAPEIYRHVANAPPTAERLALLFADYCHDSYAGFKPGEAKLFGFDFLPGTWEPVGYFRYRHYYLGDDTALVAVGAPCTAAVPA